MLQGDATAMSTPLDLIRHAGPETRVVLVIMAVLSIVSWFLIISKTWQMRKIRKQKQRFFWELERSVGLSEAYHAAMKLPPSPYTRVLREGVAFYTGLRPGGLKPADGAPVPLSHTQLEALRAILGKEIAEERERLARNIPWLATIGSVSPFLGLLGTVLGIMNAFLGISRSGAGNIIAVAPGVAEALVATATGLAVAIPAVFAYNHFANSIAVLEGDLEGLGDELIGWMAREGLL